jgi:23S rRNA pseudouridine1911/1915/1917 synthase
MALPGRALDIRISSPHREPMDRGVSIIERDHRCRRRRLAARPRAAAAVPTLSRERLKALISSGGARAGRGAPVRDPAAKAQAGRPTRCGARPAPAHNEAQDIALEIVFEDDHLLVVDKPAGMVVHPAAGNLDGTLVNALLHHCAGRLSGIGGVARPGIVHRIDKDTSGLLVVAKTDVAHEGLAAQFARHSIDRRYQAIVAGCRTPAERHGRRAARPLLGQPPEDGDRRGRPRQARGDPLPAGHAAAEAALVECRLETGRTHQVRVHMTSIGHPLLGDPVYGRTRPFIVSY